MTGRHRGPDSGLKLWVVSTYRTISADWRRTSLLAGLGVCALVLAILAGSLIRMVVDRYETEPSAAPAPAEQPTGTRSPSSGPTGGTDVEPDQTPVPVPAETGGPLLTPEPSPNPVVVLTPSWEADEPQGGGQPSDRVPTQQADPPADAEEPARPVPEQPVATAPPVNTPDPDPPSTPTPSPTPTTPTCLLEEVLGPILCPTNQEGTP
jgi:hypothetical protein